MPRPPKLWRRKGRPGWWTTIAGRQIPLGEDRGAAEREFHRLRGSGRLVQPGRATIRDLVDQYLSWAETRVKANTHMQYRNYLQSWVAHAGSLSPAALTVDHVQHWVDGHGWGQSSRSLALTILRIWAGWCEDRGYSLMRVVRKAKKPPILRRQPPMPGALEEVLAAFVSADFADFVAVLFDVGCRPGELASLEASRIDWEESTAWVIGKTGKRLVGLTAQAVAILRRHAERHPSGAVFRNRNGDPWQDEAISVQFWRARERIKRRTGKDVGAVVSYHLRHAFWGRAHRAGLSDIVIAKQMGHANLNMLAKHYADVEPEMLRDAAERAAKRQ
jgi:integrase